MIPSTTPDPETLERIRGHAEACWINGKSHIRGAERASAGPEDQMVGQLGEWALARYMGVEETYFSRREQKDLKPWEGDDGTDIDGVPVDVKTSLMRASKDPLRYNLLVRPRERHPETWYVLCLVESLETNKVFLVGGLPERALPTTVDTSGPFKGAYRMRAKLLLEMKDVRHCLKNYEEKNDH